MREVWLDLTDVTLADEDTKSKLPDNAKRAIQDNERCRLVINATLQLLEVAPPGDQICSQLKSSLLFVR